jgi:hypothetical protein
MARGLSGQILVTLNPSIMFVFVNDWYRVLSTHLTKVIMSNSPRLLSMVDDHNISFFSKVVLKGLK